MKKTNKKGFTLMEMLIVVAIIAVLVAITIPVMNGALEKSREATDAANLRSTYAQVAVNALTEGDAASATSPKMTQTESGWTTLASDTSIGGVSLASFSDVAKGKQYVFTMTADGTLTIN